MSEPSLPSIGECDAETLLKFETAEALEDEGRQEEAAAIYRGLAEAGDNWSQCCLGTLLTEMGGDHTEEGMAWLGRAVRGGNDSAAWNLAMEYRLRGDRRRYLNWARVAARLGDREAEVILTEIERRQKAALPWTMLIMVTLEKSHVVSMLSRFRDGRLGDDELRIWADAIQRRESYMRLAPDGRAALAAVVAELADEFRPLPPQRAGELIFRLG